MLYRKTKVMNSIVLNNTKTPFKNVGIAAVVKIQLIARPVATLAAENCHCEFPLRNFSTTSIRITAITILYKFLLLLGRSQKVNLVLSSCDLCQSVYSIKSLLQILSIECQYSFRAQIPYISLKSTSARAYVKLS